MGWIGMLFISSLLFNSCTKEGPEGPAGKDGNANVNSQTFYVNSPDWFSTGVSYYCNVYPSALSADILNNGAILVYMDYESTDRQLPLTIFNGTYETLYDHSMTEYNVKVEVANTNLTMPANPGYHKIRVVTMSRQMMQQHPNTDWKNYYAVQKEFHLKD